LGTIPDASRAAVHAAGDAAQRAFDRTWSTVSGAERARLMHRLADLIDERADELGRLESTDNGKILRETSGQARFAARNYRFFAAYADKLYGRTVPLATASSLNYTVRD